MESELFCFHCCSCIIWEESKTFCSCLISGNKIASSNLQFWPLLGGASLICYWFLNSPALLCTDIEISWARNVQNHLKTFVVLPSLNQLFFYWCPAAFLLSHLYNIEKKITNSGSFEINWYPGAPLGNGEMRIWMRALCVYWNWLCLKHRLLYLNGKTGFETLLIKWNAWENNVGWFCQAWCLCYV